MANMAKDGLANLGESLEEAFADLNIPFQFNKVADFVSNCIFF